MSAERSELNKKIALYGFEPFWSFIYNEVGMFMFELKTTGFWLRVDNPWIKRKRTLLQSPLYRMDNIIGIELLINSIPVSKFKREIVGSPLFGRDGVDAGALSAINATPKSKIEVTIYLDNIDLSSVTIPCLDIGAANRLISTIANLETLVNSKNDITLSDRKPESGKNIKAPNTIISDEIYRLNNLLKEGIISQEEFVAFKKKLLDQ